MHLWDPSRFVVLFPIPDGTERTIVGNGNGGLLCVTNAILDAGTDIDGVLHVVVTEHEWFNVAHMRSLTLGDQSSGARIQNDYEEIHVERHEVGGWFVWAGYGPRSRTWVVNREKPPEKIAP